MSHQLPSLSLMEGGQIGHLATEAIDALRAGYMPEVDPSEIMRNLQTWLSKTKEELEDCHLRDCLARICSLDAGACYDDVFDEIEAMEHRAVAAERSLSFLVQNDELYRMVEKLDRSGEAEIVA